MRKYLKYSLVFGWSLLLTSCSSTAPVPAPVDQTDNEPVERTNNNYEISKDEVSGILEALSSNEMEGRQTGTEGIEKAAAFIEDHFEKNNIPPYFKTYRDSFEVKGVDGYNLVGFVEGTDPQLKEETIIIGAHYDHIGRAKAIAGDSIANGANDNASGTTAVLQLAQYFKNNRPKRSIIFALFSAEEMGLVGAEKLAERLKKEGLDLYVMFNIEMIGVPMQGRDYLAYLTGFERSNLSEVFNTYAGGQVLGFLPEAKKYNLFQRSDNYAFFQEFKVPAQTVSTFDFTNYEYYHHVDDEFEKMDVDHMVHIIEALIPGLEKMANTPVKEIKMN